ncbi:galectin-4-like isoform X2 [Episyrphus balteatus]|uniref:galectin-4-like isoform X2 n=1 Tax=Episyrphus balteatus TaxID=286459 RepID=UPI0024866A6C|nr:galectin-4-like isoform X2 [Episyrphus balteatus]
MAALTFFACNAFRQIYEVSHFFIRSGFSFGRSLDYLRVKRDRYLFQKYRQELWDNQCNHSDKLCNPTLKQYNLRNKQKQFANHPSATDSILSRAADMNRGEIDFSAVEYPNDEYLGSDAGDFQVDNIDDIEIVDGQEVTDGSTFHDYIETLPVYSNDNLGDIKEGLSFTVTGYILPNCEKFSINLILETPTRDIALHVNPRLPQNYIVRNARVKNIWGSEEVSSALPFSLHRGSKFAIQILITDSCYMISVNGNHFAEFNHRLPYKSVACLEVSGDVDNINFSRTESSKYPERLPESKAKEIRVDLESEDQIDTPSAWKLITLNGCNDGGLQLPYYGLLPPKMFGSGKCLRIEGRVKLLPHSFYVNLQGGQDIWPHPIIAFHFNPRFAKQGGGIGKHVVCRNAWYNGTWAKEQRSELDTDFCPGKSFSLVIVCGMASYEVYVNKKLITEFRFHVDPEIVDTVYVQGDIKLWDVVLENHSAPNGAGNRIYQNPAYQEDN